MCVFMFMWKQNTETENRGWWKKGKDWEKKGERKKIRKQM